MHSFKGTMPPQEVLDAVRRGQIGAFCLFAFNVISPAQLRALCLALYAAAEEGGCPPPIIGIDQEGGQLIAVAEGATELPGNMALGATRSPVLAEAAGRVLGRELLAMGVNMNFAPALDINNNPNNPGIGIRSFGDSPELVSALGRAMIRGMQSEGLLATAKHFPGLGDTGTDAHFGLPVVAHSLEHMRAVELVPFRDAIESGVEAIMTGHIVFSALDDRPATLSRAVLTGLLRQEMGFEGLLVTDAMDMNAVAREGALPSIEAALRAGNDLILLAHVPNQLSLIAQTTHLLNADSAARIQRLRERLPRELPPLEVVGSDEHRQVAQKIADRAVTVVRDNGQLPLRLNAEDRLVVLTVQTADLTPADTSSKVRVGLANAISRRHPNTEAVEIPMNAGESTIRAVLRLLEDADQIIVGTISADHDEGQTALIRALCERGQQPIVVSLRTPYDCAALPMVQTYLCAYSVRPVATEAVARVLFGEIEATGVLPCALPGLAVGR
jgi:beta-N-acetylhexosaminidase